MPSDSEHELKAADVLSQSLNFGFTMATASFGVLLAFAADRELSVARGWFHAALSLLVLAALTALLTINSLINKVNDGGAAPVRAGEVRFLYTVSIVLLALGIGLGAYVVAHSQAKRDAATSALPNTTISDREIVIGSSESGKVTVSKSSDGRIERIEVLPGPGQ